jgi:hypothetical protein
MLEGVVGVVVFSVCLLVADQVMDKQRQKELFEPDGKELLRVILRNDDPLTEGRSDMLIVQNTSCH